MKFPEWLPVFGDRSFRGWCPSEEVEQINFFAELQYGHPGLARLAIHPKNEGDRNWIRQQMDAKKGEINPGASDVIIPGAPAMVAELKRQDHTRSRWQDGQVDYLETARDAGCFVFVGLGAGGMIEGVEAYLQFLSTLRERENSGGRNG